MRPVTTPNISSPASPAVKMTSPDAYSRRSQALAKTVFRGTPECRIRDRAGRHGSPIVRRQFTVPSRPVTGSAARRYGWPATGRESHARLAPVGARGGVVAAACSDDDDTSTDDTVEDDDRADVRRITAVDPHADAIDGGERPGDERGDRRGRRGHRGDLRGDDPADHRRRPAHHRRRRSPTSSSARATPTARTTPARWPTSCSRCRAARAATFGPGDDDANVESDFAWRAIGIDEIARADWATVAPEVQRVVRGVHRRLERRTSPTSAPTACPAGAPASRWVQPITGADLYAYARSITLLASSARLTGFIASAPAARPRRRSTTSTVATDRACCGPATTGSNAWAVGADLVTGGEGGLLVGNPHFPWEGELRFWEVHLTVPGELDIYGAQPHRAARRRHRVHRRVRLVAHRLGRQPLHGVHARRSTRPTRRRTSSTARSRPMTSTDHEVEVLPAGRLDDGRAAHAVVERVRPDHRLPRPRLDGDDHAHVPRRQHRQRRVRRAVPRA